jgi:hypothetical protein
MKQIAIQVVFVVFATVLALQPVRCCSRIASADNESGCPQHQQRAQSLPCDFSLDAQDVKRIAAPCENNIHFTAAPVPHCELTGKTDTTAFALATGRPRTAPQPLYIRVNVLLI